MILSKHAGVRWWALAFTVAFGPHVSLGRDLERVRVDARKAAVKRALDDADEIAALQDPLLIEETALAQRLPALVGEQRRRCPHARPMPSGPIKVRVDMSGWWQRALRTIAIVWKPPVWRGTAARRPSARSGWKEVDAHICADRERVGRSRLSQKRKCRELLNWQQESRGAHVTANEPRERVRHGNQAVRLFGLSC